MTYNGWTNYETWLVGLYYNDYWAVSFPDAIEHDPDYEVLDVCDLADFLEVDVWVLEDLPPSSQSGLLADFIRASMQRVNWNELAEHVYEDDILPAVTEKIGDLIDLDLPVDIPAYLDRNDPQGMKISDIVYEIEELYDDE